MTDGIMLTASARRNTQAWHRRPMPAGAEGATDALSSLPIIACCVFAVMVLVAAIGQTEPDGFASRGGFMEDSCGDLLGEALDLLTERSEDGRRYLDGDWMEHAADTPLPESSVDGASYAVAVRLLGEEAAEFPLNGNISGCSEVFSESAPVMLVSGGVHIPGEVIARVGL